MTDSREDIVFMAKLYEQAERYEEMVEAMKQVAELDVEMTVEERSLFSVAYKNVFGSRRAAWRTLSAIEFKEAQNGHENNVHRIRTYKQKIEDELTKICQEIIGILDNHIIPISHTFTTESKIFYCQMQGDFWRNLAQIKTGDARTEAEKRSNDAYATSRDIANKELPPTHPFRLELALRSSVYHYEFLKMPEKACQIAQKAFDDALAQIDSIGEENYQHCTVLMQLLRDNIALWKTKPKDEKDENEEE